MVSSGTYCGRAFAGLAAMSGSAIDGNPLREPTTVSAIGFVVAAALGLWILATIMISDQTKK